MTAEEKLKVIVHALDQKRAEDIRVLKVTDLTILGDYFVIANGNSTTHTRTLAEEAARAEIAAPAIIVVGGVCELAEKFAWYEELPLAGCKVVVTRPAGLVSTMSDRLRKLGAEVLEIPAIATVPIEDNEALKWAFEGIALYDWIVFTSPSGVRIFFEHMLQTCDIRALAGVKVAAIGQGTEKALRKVGLERSG